MGIVNPRPAIRKGQSRLIHMRLTRHKVLTDQYIADGMEASAASRQAYSEVLVELPTVKAARERAAK